MKRRENDALWKGILEEVFDDMLRFVFPNADELFDMNRGFEFLDKELLEMYPDPEKKSEHRSVDKLVKIYQKDGAEEWVLVHIEVQGYHDPDFPKRMFKYFCRFFDRYDRPITAIAIFTGRDGKRMPGSYARMFAGSELTYRYNTLYITDHADEALSKSENPFALVLLAAKKALIAGIEVDMELLSQKLLIVRLLFGRDLFERKKIEAILTFLNNYVLFNKTETNRIFMEQVDVITGKRNTMGIIEQVAEMRAEKAVEEAVEEKNRAFVIKLLTKTNFSVEEVAELAEVPREFVQGVKAKMTNK